MYATQFPQALLHLFFKWSHMQNWCLFHPCKDNNNNLTWVLYGNSDAPTNTHKPSWISVQEEGKKSARKKFNWQADRWLMEETRERRWPHIQPCSPQHTTTHHRPGLPLAVSQKKWLNRSRVLKLLSMIAEWEHGAPGLPTHDCGRESLISCHMTYSPIIPSGSHSTWSKWAKSQSIWMETLDVVDGGSGPMIPLKAPVRNKPTMRSEGSF